MQRLSFLKEPWHSEFLREFNVRPIRFGRSTPEVVPESSATPGPSRMPEMSQSDDNNAPNHNSHNLNNTIADAKGDDGNDIEVGSSDRLPPSEHPDLGSTTSLPSLASAFSEF